MRPHRARLGYKVLSDLVFAKCNKHLKSRLVLKETITAGECWTVTVVCMQLKVDIGVVL